MFLLPCGAFLINGNYKTYVKLTINDDYFLTIVGVLGGVANGCSRYCLANIDFYGAYIFEKLDTKLLY
jgi:hypothetical protein